MQQPERSFKPEVTVCALLLLGVVMAWSSFILFLEHSSGEEVSDFRRMRFLTGR